MFTVPKSGIKQLVEVIQQIIEHFDTQIEDVDNALFEVYNDLNNLSDMLSDFIRSFDGLCADISEYGYSCDEYQDYLSDIEDYITTALYKYETLKEAYDKLDDTMHDMLYDILDKYT